VRAVRTLSEILLGAMAIAPSRTIEFHQPPLLSGCLPAGNLGGGIVLR
jgi:hypothetical protein